VGELIKERGGERGIEGGRERWRKGKMVTVCYISAKKKRFRFGWPIVQQREIHWLMQSWIDFRWLSQMEIANGQHLELCST